MRTLKTKNKEELTAIAKEVFKRYPKAENVAVTSDGTAFITDNGLAAAKNHSVKNVYGKKLTITEFNRDELVGSKAKTDTKTAKELIAEINAEAATVDSVAAIIAAEKAGENRKTVLEAGNAKLESLKAAL